MFCIKVCIEGNYFHLTYLTYHRYTAHKWITFLIYQLKKYYIKPHSVLPFYGISACISCLRLCGESCCICISGLQRSLCLSQFVNCKLTPVEETEGGKMTGTTKLTHLSQSVLWWVSLYLNSSEFLFAVTLIYSAKLSWFPSTEIDLQYLPALSKLLSFFCSFTQRTEAPSSQFW